MIQDRQSRQLVPFSRFEVVEVVRRGNFDGAGAEREVDENRIAHDRNRAVCEGETDLLADPLVVPRIFWVDRHRAITEHSFWSGRRDGETNRWILFERVIDEIQFPCDLLMLDFYIGQGCETARAPIDQPLPSINQPVFIKPYEDFQDG